MIAISKVEYDKLRAHLEAGYPNEACGIFIGEIDGADKRVVEVVPTMNAWAPLEGDGAGNASSSRAISVSSKKSFTGA